MDLRPDGLSASPPGRAGQRTHPAQAAGVWVVASGLCASAVLLAWLRRWTCDDAFISFRYAANLGDGLGLVYNAGERVEGYTNFLWTLALAPFVAAGLDPVPTSHALGLACYVALLAWLLRTSWREAPRRPAGFLPLAACMMAVLPDVRTWATGGLETMAFTLFAAVGVFTASRAETPGALLRAGGWLSLCLLSRPDGALFVAGPLATGLLWRQGSLGMRVRRLAWLLGPVVAVGTAWGAWKLAYYDDLFPTSFYAKSAARPYLDQGLLYGALFLARNWVLVIALAAGLWLWVSRRTELRPVPASTATRACLISGSAFALYVAYSGGDFMFARRWIPVLPLFLLPLEEIVASRPVLRGAGTRATLALATALIAMATLPFPVLTAGRPRIRGIADEPRFYTPENLEARRIQAQAAAEGLRGLPVRVAFEGGMCGFGYWSRLPYLVEITGLTQYSLAKKPLAERGFIGHEKLADASWYADHGIHLLFRQRWPWEVAAAGEPWAFNRITLGGVCEGKILRYDDAIMEELGRRPGVRFQSIDNTLERARRSMEVAAGPEAEALLRTLDGYYFRQASGRREAVRRELLALAESRRR